MNEVEYILRIVLKARDELAGALKRAREELRLFANAAESNKSKIDAFNTSIEAMVKNVGDVTDKFQQWRAVMEGTAGENAKARKSFGDLGREVDSASKSIQRSANEQERAAKAQDKLLKSADKLRNEYRKLNTEEALSDKNRGFTLARLQQIGRELDSISKKVDDPKIRRFYYDWAMDAKFAANEIVNSNKQIVESNKQVLKQEEDSLAKRKKLSEDLRRERDAFTRAEAVRARMGKSDFGAFDRDEAKLVIKALQDVAGQYEETSKTSRKARVEAYELSTELRNQGREVDRTTSSFSKLRAAMQRNEASAASLDNAFRGMGWFAAAVFAQQLVTILGGLGGAFVAVSASAVQAGAAIGGVFVAGVMQAMPAIGLLSAALFRVSSVMDAVKQAQTTQQQQAVQQAGASRRVADATDAIANAQERLRDATEGLQEAREDARDDLEDLIRAEQNAALAAAGAALSQKEAQEALIAAQASGDVGGIQRAQLAVLQAQADAEESIANKRKARRDAEKAEAGGVEGMEGVVQAKRAIDDAQRGLETAKRNAGEAAAGTITAAAQLNYLLAQLSPAERRLYDALTNIREAYKATYRPITDLIIDSFTRSVEGVEKIMMMPEVISMARDTAETVADQLNRIFDAFTTEPVLDQLLRIAEEGRKNLKPLADIVISLGESFIDIAEAGGPALSLMLEFVGGLATEFGNLVGNTDKLAEFFITGEEHFEAWINLGLAVIELFAALSGAGGAETGLNLVEDATKAINGLVDGVKENREDVAAFFEDSRDIIHEIVGVVVALAVELHKAFTPERVKNFADLMKEVVIPALGDAIELLGKVTDALLDIAETPAGKAILQMFIGFLFLSKILAPLLKPLGWVLDFFKWLAKIGPVAKLLDDVGKALGRIAGNARFLTFGARFLGIAGAVIFLLDALGLLDDAWREVKSGFEAFWNEVQPSLEELMDSFKDLWKAVSEGKGLFGILAAILRPVLKVVIEIGGVFLRVFGRAIGRVIGGVIDVLSGFMDFLTGVFTGDWEKAWDGIKKMFRGIWRAITAPIRALPELIEGIGKKLLPALRDGAEALWGWLEKLPGRLGHLASEAASAFVDGFKGVAGDIISGIAEGLKATGGFAKDLINGFIDLINSLLPNKISIPIGPDIDLPDNPIKHIQSGGPIGKGYGGGDRILGLLEAGEHVLTKEEVAAMGGHGAVYALRRALGGGGQGRSGRFADGGEVGAAGTLTVVFQGGGMNEFSAAWRDFWELLQLIARRGTTLVAAQFRNMRVATTRTMDRMYRDVRSSLADLEKSFDARGRRIVDSWADTWMSLKKVTHEGLFYIGHETNQAMRALGEKSINFGLTTPKKADDGKAGGGWIGSKGQRGRDRGFYPLGAGEAVLNWQHQNYVEPAMNAYYGHGLSDMFRRTRGYHAGGPGQTGFAGGGMVEIDATGRLAANTKLARVIMQMMRRYKFAISAAGEGGHSTNSDHHWGGALDLVPGTGGSWALLGQLARAAGWQPNQGGNVTGGPFRWVGWNTEASHGQPPRPNAHLHLSWRRGGPFLGPEGMKAIEEIGRLIVKGIEPMKELVQSALDKVRSAANKKIEEVEGVGGESAPGSQPLGPGGPAEKVFDYFVGRGLSPEIAAGFVGTFQKESNFVTTVRNLAGSGATGLAQWLGDRLTRLQAKPNWQSLQVQLDYVWEELMGPESAAFAAIKRAKTPAEAATIIDSMYERSDNILNAPANAEQAYQRFADSADHGPRRRYAEGGIVPGPEGAPVPALVHAAEWILNPRQVQRLANMVGVSRDALRSMMGFYGGGAAGYQGGTGDLTAEDIPALTRRQARTIDATKLRKLVVALIGIGEDIDKAAVHLGTTQKWTKRIRTSMLALEKTGDRIAKRLSDDDTTKSMRGFLDAVGKLTHPENGLFAKMRITIERRAEREARRLQREELVVSGPRRATVVRRTEDLVGVAQRSLTEQQRQRPALVRERVLAERGLAAVTEELKEAKRLKLGPGVIGRLRTEQANLRAVRDESQQRVIDNLVAIADAQEAYDQAIIEAQEAKVQAIQDATDKVNDTASRSLGRLDLAGRMLDALGRVGLGGIVPGGRGAIFGQREATLQTQRAGLVEQLGKATALGGTGTPELIEELNDAIAELDVSIQENTRAYFDARVDDVNNRANFALNINDLNKQLIELDGQIAGNTDQAALLLKSQERQAILIDQGNELAALLAEATPGTEQYQELQIAVLENTVAQRQNTIATNELTGAAAEPQTFTSSAWARYGEAIFNGMGQVLTQYNPANMMGEINTGAVIYPASSTNSTRVSGDTNINLYEAGHPVDLEEVSSAVVWGSKTSQ